MSGMPAFYESFYESFQGMPELPVFHLWNGAGEEPALHLSSGMHDVINFAGESVLSSFQLSVYRLHVCS